jgi:hypothetical protein
MKQLNLLYELLYKAYMIRVLIETGFTSLMWEGNRLDSEEGQNKRVLETRLQMRLSYKMSITVMVNDLLESKPSQNLSKISKVLHRMCRY